MTPSTNSTAGAMLPVESSTYDLEDEEDEAGFQAMLSDLPQIVTISGFLDGDFDELNEIRELLAPPVSDDDADRAKVAKKATSVSDTSEDPTAKYSYQVPNPIPDRVPNPIPSWGRSSETKNIISSDSKKRENDSTQQSRSEMADGSSKKARLNSTVKTTSDRDKKRTDNIRTFGNGIPNPLSVDRPVQWPSGNQQVAEQKANCIAKRSSDNSPPQKMVEDSSSQLKASTSNSKKEKATSPRVRISSTSAKSSAPAKVFAIYQSLSYAIPQEPVRPKRAALCKIAFIGKVEDTVVSTETSIGKVLAPRLQVEAVVVNAKSKTDRKRSGTASNKKPPTKKKKPVKAKSSPAKDTVALSNKTAIPKSVSVASETHAEDEGETSKGDMSKKNIFLVANPLANVPHEPPKAVAPVVIKKTSRVSSSSCASFSSCPSVVSSNGSVEEVKSAMTKTTNKSMATAEKAEVCRNRNRKHAKNTRLRKKAYLEELKKSLIIIAEQRDQLLAEKQQKMKTKEARKRAMQDFLRLRGQSSHQEKNWQKLVENDKTFTLTLPETKYRSMVHGRGGNSDQQQVLVGVHDVMTDANYFTSFLEAFAGVGAGDEGGETSRRNSIQLQFNFEESWFLMDGCTGILNWQAKTSGATAHGTGEELSLCGTFRATFASDDNKLASGILMFDTSSIQAQLPQQ